MVLLYKNRNTYHIQKKKKEKKRKKKPETELQDNIAKPTASCSLFNKSEYMQVFPSSSHGPKVAVIIANGQHAVREQSEIDWLIHLFIDWLIACFSQLIG